MLADLETISALIEEKEYNKALRALDHTLETNIRSVFDFSLAHQMKSGIYMSQSDYFMALAEIIAATQSTVDSEGNTLYFMPAEVLEPALRQKFLLATSVNQLGLAWDTYQEMQKQFELDPGDTIHEQARAVAARLDSHDPLSLIARINDKQWTHTPTRRIFTITDVDGRISRINARCERRNQELEFEEGVDWNLPATWGRCELDIVGRKGTQFTLFEFYE